MYPNSISIALGKFDSRWFLNIFASTGNLIPENIYRHMMPAKLLGLMANIKNDKIKSFDH